MREPGRERGRGLASRFWPGASRRMWEQRPHTHDVRECCLPGRLRKPQTWKGRARPIPGQCGGPGLITAQLIKSWSGRYLGADQPFALMPHTLPLPPPGLKGNMSRISLIPVGPNQASQTLFTRKAVRCPKSSAGCSQWRTRTGLHLTPPGLLRTFACVWAGLGWKGGAGLSHPHPSQLAAD